MILEIPVLNGVQYNDATASPRMVVFGERYALNFANSGDTIVFMAALPSGYLGASLDVKLYWMFPLIPTPPQSVTWSLQIEKLTVGNSLLLNNYSTPRIVTDASSDPFTIVTSTINLPLADLASITAGNLFRLKVVSDTVSPTAKPYLLNLALFNGS